MVNLYAAAAKRWPARASLGLTLLGACKSEPEAPKPVPAATGGSRSVSSAAREAPSPAPAVVFLGDSLTAGYGLAQSEAVPARIQALVDRGGLPYRVVNAGRSGDTTAGGLARLQWYLRDSVNLRALVIGLGSNDAMRGLPIESMKDNLRSIIETARQARPEARIFLWAMKTFPNLGKQYRTEYEEAFTEIASLKGVTLLPFPLEKVAGKPELNQADGIHPTAEGASLVAESIWKTLGPALQADRSGAPSP